MDSCHFSFSLLLFRLFPSFPSFPFPFPLCPFCVPMVALPIKLGNLMSAVSSPTGLCSDKLFLTLPVTALSRKFSDNQLYIVTRILAMRHAGIVFLREEVALWFRLEPAREGAVSHIVRYRPTSSPDFTSLLWILIYSDKLADFFLPRPNV